MKKHFLVICILFFSKSIHAQKIINNPDSKGINFSARVTKVELSDKQTVLHFILKGSTGSRFSISQETYIENSLEGKRMYVTKSEGLSGINGWNIILDTDGFGYKLYFPALNKNVKTINYGEANDDGTWFIFKLDVTKDGTEFLNDVNANQINNYNNVRDSLNFLDYKTFQKPAFNNNFKRIDEQTLLSEKIPKGFFGNWYDKYGTLILVSTQDYILFKSQILYYKDVYQNSNTNFSIKTLIGDFEILDMDDETMTVRIDRITVLKKRNYNIKNT